MGELLETIGSAELTEWAAFASIEPFGGPIEDLRAGLAPAITYNIHRNKDAPTLHPFDLYPWHDKSIGQPQEPAAPDTPETTSARLRDFLNAKSKG